MLIDELLASESFYTVLINPYGNYVVQKMLEQADSERKHKLINVAYMNLHRKLNLICQNYKGKSLAEKYTRN